MLVAVHDEGSGMFYEKSLFSGSQTATSLAFDTLNIHVYPIQSQ